MYLIFVTDVRRNVNGFNSLLFMVYLECQAQTTVDWPVISKRQLLVCGRPFEPLAGNLMHSNIRKYYTRGLSILHMANGLILFSLGFVTMSY
jgi:hypothetical protein